MVARRSTNDRPTWLRDSILVALEALGTGLAYGAALCWASVCLLGSFRPDDLSAPYWSGMACLRSDTTGIIAFFVVAVCLCTSEFLRLRRRRVLNAMPSPRASDRGLKVLILAVSETVAILATGLVIYLSVNAVTHPVTLGIHATHLVSWPTEGTLWVFALLLCICSVTALRYLLAGRTGVRGNRPDTLPTSTEGGQT